MFGEQHSMHMAAGRRHAFVDNPYPRSDGQRALTLHAGNSVNTGCPSASSRVMSAAHNPPNEARLCMLNLQAFLVTGTALHTFVQHMLRCAGQHSYKPGLRIRECSGIAGT